ncbi:hypothetical protein FHG87_014280 [Trinorchestia longiramus]|nr:hypothetical protein FHG87_014280 [Trinorchestia longiramus]
MVPNLGCSHPMAVRDDIPGGARKVQLSFNIYFASYSSSKAMYHNPFKCGGTHFMPLKRNELSATVASRKEFETEQLGVSAALREELAQCQHKLLSSTSTAKDIKTQLDNLRDESTSRLLEVGAQCECLQHELDTLVASNEYNEKSNLALVAAAREERNAAESAVVLMQGELQALQLSHSKLQTLADDRLSIVDDVTKELLALREQFNECKSINDAEVKNLHDKLSKQGCSLCEYQQQLRKEQMLNLQQKMQLQLEIQRVSELKEHNKALLKQNEELNKVLADQLDRKVADDVKNILKSLKPQTDDFQSVRKKNYDCKSNGGRVFNDVSEGESIFISPVAKTNSFSKPEFENIPEVENHCFPFGSRVKLSTSFDSDRNTFSRQKYSVNNCTASRLPCDFRRLPIAGRNPSDLTNHLADLQCIEESMEAFAARDTAYKAPATKLDDDKDEDVTQPMNLTRFSSSSLMRRLRSLRASSLSPEREDRFHDSKYCSSRESISTRPRPITSHRGEQLSPRVFASHRSPLTTRNSDIQTSADVDSGVGSSCSKERDETGVELRRARAEARKERLEAVKLRERNALLRVEVDSQKAALENERSRYRFKSRLNRVKREEFGQFLGELEGNLDRHRPSSLHNCSLEDTLNATADFCHSASVSRTADVHKTSTTTITGSVLAATPCVRSFDLTESDVSVNGVRLGACRTDNEETGESNQGSRTRQPGHLVLEQSRLFVPYAFISLCNDIQLILHM